ncbi:MAG: cardiolipin synthase [Bacillota bacterium]|nr:cardiolipin synthase [Bacillota bacterium]
MKKSKEIIASRNFKLIILIILQVIAVFFFINNLAAHRTVIYDLMVFSAILLGISILAKDDLNPVYKLMWVFILASLPIIGTVIYLFWGDRKITKRKAAEISYATFKSKTALFEFPRNVDPERLSGCESTCAKYLRNYAKAPVFENTTASYYGWGEKFFEKLLEELGKAEKFIFIEYFIISNGYMWDKTYEVLRRKAEEGVDVRIIYDAFGSMLDLPEDFWIDMRNNGIKCYRFNPIHFSWKLTDYTFLNHRDHRKICVIDGNTGFTGGINLSDEYINLKHCCGKWKDTAVMLKGDGVYALTNTFLKMWEYVSGDINEDYTQYAPTVSEKSDFFVQPYDDSPLDVENVSENSYFNVICHARKYVYITTPYLIIDHEMVTALSLAAKSGVDVRIIIPGIPDKKYVYYLTQSYYPELVRAGVKIYEYKLGFMHAKMFVRDDEQAIVGSANMDYRSLYLHFENCCAFYGGHIVQDVKNDIKETLKDCRQVTAEDIKKVPKLKRAVQLVLKFFAPVM